MDELEQDRLIAEYNANIELWKHDDMLRQQRIGNFLNINAALVTAFAVVVGLKPPLLYLAGVAVLFALFGLTLCRTWRAVQLRNSEYIRLRRFILTGLEAKLPGMTTFRTTYRVLYDHESVEFPAPLGIFRLDAGSRTSSTIVENGLPRMMEFLWAAVALGAGFMLLQLVPGVPHVRI